MTVWRFEDDCLAPHPRLKVDYVGKNPFKVYQVARNLLRKTLEVETIDLWERDFRWDISSDPRMFFCRIYVDKGIDARSRAFIEVTIQGTQPSDPNKEGRVTIYIGGRLRTVWEMNTAFQRSPIYKAFLWLYHKIFYEKVRRGYLRLCARWIEELKKGFMDVLNISQE